MYECFYIIFAPIDGNQFAESDSNFRRIAQH